MNTLFVQPPWLITEALRDIELQFRGLEQIVIREPIRRRHTPRVEHVPFPIDPRAPVIASNEY